MQAKPVNDAAGDDADDGGFEAGRKASGRERVL